jgi:fermentation-respiration switch protein FrsA (DUF1100 family)
MQYNKIRVAQPRGWDYFPSKVARRILLIVATSIAILILAGTLWLNHQAKALTTGKRPPMGGTPLDYGWVYQEVTLTTVDGVELSGWYIPGTRPAAVIVVHGLFAHKQYSLPIGSMLARYGYHVLLIDLRAHGASQGDKVTFGYHESLDIQAAVDFLQEKSNIEQIGAVGYSLGGAAVIRAATTDEELGPLVIISSYSSLSDAVDDGFAQFSDLPQRLFKPLIVKTGEWNLDIEIDQVDSVRDLAALSPRPILIMHSRDDNLFPVAHAYRMYEAAPTPKELFLMKSYDHDDSRLFYKDDYQKYIVNFFDNAFLYQAGSSE